ncbi:hypothetical protein BpHYR1_034520 [Brachionus plicatilis]|uniref:Uncharacterized protein n=1 Tax=Brachionus plicatilis TaxID=10195 RepID=A0A3M7RPL6_BRAPC|nr:hypothetical protein BpHYR1_034520 [Brachionus plicatilis]
MELILKSNQTKYFTKALFLGGSLKLMLIEGTKSKKVLCSVKLTRISKIAVISRRQRQPSKNRI